MYLPIIDMLANQECRNLESAGLKLDPHQKQMIRNKCEVQVYASLAFEAYRSLHFRLNSQSSSPASLQRSFNRAFYYHSMALEKRQQLKEQYPNELSVNPLFDKVNAAGARFFRPVSNVEQRIAPPAA